MEQPKFKLCTDSDSLRGIAPERRIYVASDMFKKAEAILPKRPLVLMSLSTGGGQLEYEFIRYLSYFGKRVARLYVMDMKYTNRLSNEARQMLQLRPMVDDLIISADMSHAAMSLHGLKPDLVMSGNFQIMDYNKEGHESGKLMLLRALEGCPHIQVMNEKGLLVKLTYCTKDAIYHE